MLESFCKLVERAVANALPWFDKLTTGSEEDLPRTPPSS
jgi:hypothetical protein